MTHWLLILEYTIM